MGFLKRPVCNLGLRARLVLAGDAANLRLGTNIACRLFLVARIIMDWAQVLVFVRATHSVRVVMIKLDRLAGQQWVATFGTGNEGHQFPGLIMRRAEVRPHVKQQRVHGHLAADGFSHGVPHQPWLSRRQTNNQSYFHMSWGHQELR